MMLTRKIFYFLQAQKRQWAKPSEIENLQKKMLRDLVTHAFRHTIFYRRKWKECRVRPEDIKNVEDLKKLPIVTKEDVIKNYNQFIALNYQRFYDFSKIKTMRTSGYSGMPLRIIFDERADDYREGIYLRSLLAVGYNPRKPLAYYWYEPFERKLYNRLGFMNKIYIPSSLSEERQIEMLQRFNPEYIHYFPSILYSIAKRIEFEGITLNPKLIITSGDVLSKKMREVIEEAFDAPVYDQYRMIELGSVAWECKERGCYHIDADSIVLEVVKENESASEGERGIAVCTNLTNFLFPLIRYETGDVVIPTSGRCSCGRTLPLIKGIEGRSSEIIKLVSGRILTPKMIIDSIADVGVYKFKLDFTKGNKVRVNLVLLDRKKKEGVLEEVKNRLNNLLKEKFTICFRIVNDIPKIGRGKRKLISFAP
jgi:phenylacetate-CoA ligase